MDCMGIEQNALCGGGFTSIDVSDNTNVTNACQSRCWGRVNFGTIRAGSVGGIHGVFFALAIGS